MKRSTGPLLVVVVAAFLGAGAGPAVAPLDPPVTLRVGTNEITGDAGIFVALSRGYFKAEGLNVELQPFDTAVKQIAPLAAGQLDIAVGAISASLFNAIARGIPMKIVSEKGSAFEGRSASAFTVRKDLVDSGRYKTFRDLKGLKVAISARGNSPHVQLGRILDGAGLKEEDIELVTMAFPQMNVAFETRAIDAAMFQEPFTSRAVAQGLIARPVLVWEIYPRHTVGVILYGPDLVARKAEAGRRFMAAYLRGARDYNDAMIRQVNRPEVVRILTQFTRVKDPRTYDQMVPAGLSSNGELFPEGIAADQQWYHRKGLVEKPVDLGQVIDLQYLRYALDRLGRWERD